MAKTSESLKDAISLLLRTIENLFDGDRRLDPKIATNHQAYNLKLLFGGDSPALLLLTTLRSYHSNFFLVLCNTCNFEFQGRGDLAKLIIKKGPKELGGSFKPNHIEKEIYDAVLNHWIGNKSTTSGANNLNRVNGKFAKKQKTSLDMSNHLQSMSSSESFMSPTPSMLTLSNASTNTSFSEITVSSRSTIGKAGKAYDDYDKDTIRKFGKELDLDNNLNEFIISLQSRLSNRADPNLARDLVLNKLKKADDVDDIRSLSRKLRNAENATKDILATYISQVEDKHVPPYATYTSLSVLTLFYTLKEVNGLCEQFGTGFKVSRYNWKVARIHGKLRGHGAWYQAESQTRSQYYTFEQLTFLVDTIYSKDFVNSVAYGVHSIKLTSGRSISLPSCIRKSPHELLYDKYQKLCYSGSLEQVKRTIFYDALNVASTKDDIALAALDSVSSKCGDNNFTSMADLVDIVCEGRPQLLEQLKNLITQVVDFLHDDFKGHLNNKVEEKCPYHSIRWATAGVDPSSCEHDIPNTEMTYCKRCEQPQVLMKNIESSIISMDFHQNTINNCNSNIIRSHNETKESLLLQLQKVQDRLDTYISHLVRSHHEKDAYEDCLAGLKENELAVIVDYKMKLNPMYHREAQTLFFGKRGISWLGVMFVRRKSSEEIDEVDGDIHSEFTTQYIDLLSDDSTENAFAVASGLEVALKQYKSVPCNSHITCAHLFSDGAGAFSGTELFASLACFGKLTGISILSHTVSEAGQGKSKLDNHFAWAMKKLRKEVIIGAGKADVTCAATAREALMKHNIGPGSSLVLVIKIKRSMEFECYSLPSLNKHAQRTYVYNERMDLVTVKLHAVSRLGEGKVMTADAVNRLFKRTSHFNFKENGSECEIVLENDFPEYKRQQLQIWNEIITNSATKDYNVCKEDRVKSAKIRGIKIENASNKIIDRHREEVETKKHKWLNSNLHVCSDAICVAAFASRDQLNNHEKKGIHHYSDSLVQCHHINSNQPVDSETGKKLSLMDMIILLCEEKSMSGSVKIYDAMKLNGDQAAVTILPNTYQLFACGNNFIPILPKRGWALKQSGKRYIITHAMLELVLNLFLKGETSVNNVDAQKINADNAVKYMALHGTEEGAKLFPQDAYWTANATNTPTFPLFYRFDIFQIKGYFSRSKDDLQQVLHNAAGRSINAADASANPQYIQQLIDSNLINSNAVSQTSRLYSKKTLKSMQNDMEGEQIQFDISHKKHQIFPLWFKLYHLRNSNSMDIDNSSDVHDSVMVIQNYDVHIDEDDFVESSSDDNETLETLINDLIDQDEVENNCAYIIDEWFDSNLLEIDDIPEHQ